MEENLKNALLEAVWLMRWNKDKTSMVAVLTEKEADKMCKDILKELDAAGYDIVKKSF